MPTQKALVAKETCRILIQRRDRSTGKSVEMIIEIPKNWKVTFGKLHASGGDAGRYPDTQSPLCLRIYENEKQQRAIFTDVTHFRDLSIPVKIKMIEIDKKTGQTIKKGEFKSFEEVNTNEEWQDEEY